MNRRTASIGLAGCALLLVAAAGQPRALEAAVPGVWEISGIPGLRADARRCVQSAAALAVVEHRGQACASSLVSEQGTSAVIHYSCKGGGFGQSKLTLITPRSLRIETQGISRGAPFNYTVQARRSGNCRTH
jgi:hypothetical protein